MSPGRFSAVFVDRDGVINRAGHRVYVGRVEDFVFMPGAIEGLKRLRAACDRLIVITNQSGIGRGLFSEADYRAVRRHMHDELRAAGVALDDEFFCPHHPTEGKGDYRAACDCRKPGIGMFLAARDRYGIDLARSCMIGDSGRDLEAAKAAGCMAVQVCSSPRHPLADAFFTDLAAASAQLSH